MFKHFIGHISSKFSLVQTSNNFRHRTNCIAHKPMKFGICLSNSTFGYIQCDTVGSTLNLRSKVKQFISWEQASKLMNFLAKGHSLLPNSEFFKFKLHNLLIFIKIVINFNVNFPTSVFRPLPTSVFRLRSSDSQLNC
jgi:hypothetical protein